MDSATDADRLARYDRFAEEIRAEFADTRKRLADLRAQDKVKTATYQQLFASRMTLEGIDRRLRNAGL